MNKKDVTFGQLRDTLASVDTDDFGYYYPYIGGDSWKLKIRDSAINVDVICQGTRVAMLYFHPALNDMTIFADICGMIDYSQGQVIPLDTVIDSSNLQGALTSALKDPLIVKEIVTLFRFISLSTSGGGVREDGPPASSESAGSELESLLCKTKDKVTELNEVLGKYPEVKGYQVLLDIHKDIGIMTACENILHDITVLEIAKYKGSPQYAKYAKEFDNIRNMVRDELVNSSERYALVKRVMSRNMCKDA